MIYDLAIIGGATSGLTAGIYAARKKLNAIILTKEIGGQTIQTESIENFPGFENISGMELIGKIKAQVLKYGLPVKSGSGVRVISKKEDMFEVETESGEKITAKSVIIATGKNPRRLNVPGEKEFENKGVVYCSTCDAPLFGGKDVVVVGGGNSGLGSAFDLLKYANNVFVMETADKLRGDELLQEKLKASGKVVFMTNVDVKEIKGTKFVEEVVYFDKKTGEEKTLKAQGLFVSVGWSPSSSFAKGFVEMNEYEEIVINQKTNETSVKGVFASGDVTDIKYKQCIIAAGEGAKAALSVYDYLKGK
ncbi:MAG: Alkyl hydroperoxide reductase, F subunit [Candidatus Falkowbacteria bacterium GW2011_GWA2_41_14]|uniref:Alkyl hydroperoxide reductase, F subunit n=1 Tax=Candidatus Falkowbacteria bacterium GW2011_GWA2_41_14 TaxID=1618635 RepID=A0A0G0URN2_9BACT|nr:MAG: Alkyl hydroperoxide reductase, F subunit [Candidatus Falkowbacteria bacterium GW2011_GWA2_41_14]